MGSYGKFACCWLTLTCLLMLGCTISSTPGTLTPVSLSIQPANPSLPLGLAQAFLAVVQLHDGTSQDVTSLSAWSSSTTAVATIDKTGTLQTLSQGTTTITAHYGSFTATSTVTVTAPAVIAVNITPATPNPIQTGDTLQFTATGTMSDGTTPPNITGKVAWTSSNSSAVSIVSGGSGAGLATANAVGVSLIKATYGSGQNAPVGFVTVIVNPLLQSITVLPAAVNVAKSTTQQFTAIGIYSDGSTQDLTTQTSTQWSCSPTGIATSISNGLAKVGSTPGSCNVTAAVTLSNGTTVVNSPASTLTVGSQSLGALSITAAPTEPIGIPVQFHATGDFGGSVQDLTAVVATKWTSSDTAVATNPIAGKTTTVTAGSSLIGAQFGSPTASTNLTVSTAKLSSISITAPLTKLGEGTNMQLTATGKFSDGTTQDLSSAVTWKSSGRAISVSKSGFVTANLQGSATVTATLGGVSGTSPTLQVNAVTIKSVTISPGTASIAPGTTLPFKAKATFGDNTQQDVTNLVQWSSSNPTAVTIQDFGTNAGVAAGLATGTTSISAIYGSVKASTSTLAVSKASPSAVIITASPTMTLGTSQQLKASVTFSDGTSQDVTSSVLWSSSDISVLVVTSSGMAMSVATGSASISATFTPPSGPPVTSSDSITVQ